MSRLVLGAPRALAVRRERVVVGGAARLLYASDLHLGLPWTRTVPGLLHDCARDARPDAILLGGDLVERAAGLAALDDLLRRLAAIAPVAAVPGNHDVRSGVEAVRATVVGAGVHWLPDAPLAVGEIGVDARPAAGAQVLCGHDPVVWPHARAAGCTLTLAGHLHGCQATWRRRTAGRELPGAWFYRWNGPRFEDGGATLLVSRGAADTLPVRWNCPHEVLLVECV